MLYPKDYKNANLQSDVVGVELNRVFHGTLSIAPVAPDVAAAKVATAVAAVETVLTVFTAPDVARNVTATAAGTAADIAAVQIVLVGTDMAGDALTETLPVFTENTAGIVEGAKAFATITSATVPAMDGAGVTISIGYGDIAGIPAIAISEAMKPTAVSATALTVVASTTELASNTFTKGAGDFDGSAHVLLIAMQ